MQAPPVQKVSFSHLLVQSPTQDRKNPDTPDLVNRLGEILHVLVSYLSDDILKKLMQVSRRVLWQVAESNIPIPLSLCVNSDFANKLQLAKSKLDGFKTKTNRPVSFEVCIRSEHDTWADDFDVLKGFEFYINSEDVRGIVIGNLYVNLKEISEQMAKCISSLKNLQKLDLTGYHCDDGDIFKDHFASELTLNTLKEVHVNMCSVRVLPILCMTNEDLHVFKLHARGWKGDRASIFSILSESAVVTLRRFSVRFLRVLTREESAVFRKFVQRQGQLSELSLSLFEVSPEACPDFVGMLKESQFGSLKLRRLEMKQPRLGDVIKQIANTTQLTSLTLTENHCIEPNADILCGGLGDMTNLRQLKLSDLCLSAHGVSELAGALTNLQRLQQLDLSNNRFHDIKNMSPFVAALTAFSKLTRLRVGNCGMTEGVRRQMETVLQKQI